MGVHVMNTTVRNTMEQSLTFITLLWLSTFFRYLNLGNKASNVDIVIFGWAWIAFRLLYPVAYGSKGGSVFLSTLPAYACQLYFCHCLFMDMSKHHPMLNYFVSNFVSPTK